MADQRIEDLAQVLVEVIESELDIVADETLEEACFAFAKLAVARARGEDEDDPDEEALEVPYADMDEFEDDKD